MSDGNPIARLSPELDGRARSHSDWIDAHYRDVERYFTLPAYYLRPALSLPEDAVDKMARYAIEGQRRMRWHRPDCARPGR